LGLLMNKASGGRIPVRFIFFALVGLSGVAIHLLTVNLALLVPGMTFTVAQSIAVVVAMTTNFYINNAITYRDAKLKGFGPILRGLLYFYAVCAFGAVANVGVAAWLYNIDHVVWVSALAGVIMGSVWNYTLSSLFVWRKD
ncbi:GtrA family protein, partial [Rhodoblastus sp.]|uniref:GtrA family protein n=1 Tax=Rhodoblastus sp. TaxID=1962975 RepID=UPI0035B3B0EE